MTTKTKTPNKGGRPRAANPVLKKTVNASLMLTQAQKDAIDRARGGTPFATWCRDRLMEAVEREG